MALGTLGLFTLGVSVCGSYLLMPLLQANTMARTALEASGNSLEVQGRLWLVCAHSCSGVLEAGQSQRKRDNPMLAYSEASPIYFSGIYF